MRRHLVTWLAPLVVGVACSKAPPDAEEGFNDAIVETFVQFEGEADALAFAVRTLEIEIYSGMDVEAENEQDRALSHADLTEDDVAHLEHPDRDPALALPVAVAGVSAFEIDQHKLIQALTDHTPVEPYSPDQYDRTFLDGTEDCWFDHGCEVLHTHNVLVKKNALMELPYEFRKDFRWIDLNLPDPGETERQGPEERWAYVGRSWTTQRYSGVSDDTHLEQSFTIEVWLPRDGGGFIATDDRADSSGGGVLRMLGLWSETTFDGIDFSDNIVAGTTRKGIDDNFKAAEEWLAENAE